MVRPTQSLFNQIRLAGRMVHDRLPAPLSVDSTKMKRLMELKSDERILYCSFIDNISPNAFYINKIVWLKELEKYQKSHLENIPVSVRKVLEKEKALEAPDVKTLDKALPVDIYDTYKMDDTPLEEKDAYEFLSVKEDVQRRLEAYNQKDESVYEDRYTPYASPRVDEVEKKTNQPVVIDLEILNHGTPDPAAARTNTICGGCGAHFHCQDESLPGYIPSEALKACTEKDLMSLVCQRCYFLRVHNIALGVRVSPKQYMNALKPVQKSNAMVVLVVDLFDSPCGVWKGLSDIIGKRRPIIIVGNKIDLLPPDRHGFLQAIKEGFESTLAQTDIWNANIVDLKLVSAKTGYGVEELISSIEAHNGANNDLYLLGCTNAGKSSLFNALLGSDMCKSDRKSLIQRATSSPWPGTTLNLLKFPMRPITGEGLVRRQARLAEAKSYRLQENRSSDHKQISKNFSLATLRASIGRTFEHDDVLKKAVGFSIGGVHTDPLSEPKSFETPTPQIYGRKTTWCYDTPGVVQPEQLISLLTHDELVMSIPKTIIEPKTFTLRSGMSLLLGGLARLDVVYTPSFIRMTVFRSRDLPTVIVKTVDASAFYREYLGTEVLGAPSGDAERLKSWNPIQPVSLSLMGLHEKRSFADIVLSSAGYVALTAKRGEPVDLRAWTPGARGVYVRKPYLPDAVMLKGPRQKGTVCHGKHSVFIPFD